MAIQEVQDENQTAVTKETKSSVAYARKSYSDLPNRKPEQIDVIQQFNANLSQLEDLQGRLTFMMSELKSLLVKRKF